MNKIINYFILLSFLLVAPQNGVAADLPGFGNIFNISRWAETFQTEGEVISVSVLKPKKVWSCNHVLYRMKESSELLYETTDFVKAIDIFNLSITVEQMLSTGKSFYKNALATKQNLFHDFIFEFQVQLKESKPYAVLNSSFSYDVASAEVPNERVSYVNDKKNVLQVRMNYLDVCSESNVHVISLDCLNLTDPACRNGEVLKINTKNFKELWQKNYDQWSSL